MTGPDRREILRGAVPRRVPGFTLIELMIVVAVVAILAAIAYPSYQEHIRKTRRAQAKADLVEYAQLAERYHTVNNSYEGFTLPASQSPREEGATAQYNLVLTVDKKTAASQFRITAEPTGAQAEDRCGKLSLDQASVKRHSKGDYKECW